MIMVVYLVFSYLREGTVGGTISTSPTITKGRGRGTGGGFRCSNPHLVFLIELLKLCGGANDAEVLFHRLTCFIHSISDVMRIIEGGCMRGGEIRYMSEGLLMIIRERGCKRCQNIVPLIYMLHPFCKR